MNRKIIMIISIIAALAIVSLLFFYFINNNAPKDETIKEESGPKLLPVEELKKSDRIVIGNGGQTVEVENPYKIASSIISPKDVVVTSNNNFDILFFDYNGKKSFLIDLHGGNDFNAVRIDAENKFLELLKINKEQACLLDVSEGVSELLNPDLVGKDLNLSFCPNKK